MKYLYTSLIIITILISLIPYVIFHSQETLITIFIAICISPIGIFLDYIDWKDINSPKTSKNSLETKGKKIKEIMD